MFRPLYRFRPAKSSSLALASTPQPVPSDICRLLAPPRVGKHRPGPLESCLPIQAWTRGLCQWPRELGPGWQDLHAR